VGYERGAFTNALDALEKGDMLYFVFALLCFALLWSETGKAIWVYIGGPGVLFWSLLYFYQFMAKEMPIPSFETCAFSSRTIV
jgi:hypothetical protein